MSDPADEPLRVSLKPSEMHGSWVVAHVRGGFERKIADDLADVRRRWDADFYDHPTDLGWFLPAELVRYRDAMNKSRTRERLLYPKYLFVCVRDDLDERYWLVEHRYVHRLLRVADQARLAKHLDDLQLCLASGVYLEHYPEIVVGRRCRVRRGPLMGLEGDVIVRDDKKRIIVLQVQLLGGGHGMEVENIDDLEPVGD